KQCRRAPVSLVVALAVAVAMAVVAVAVVAVPRAFAVFGGGRRDGRRPVDRHRRRESRTGEQRRLHRRGSRRRLHRQRQRQRRDHDDDYADAAQRADLLLPVRRPVETTLDGSGAELLWTGSRPSHPAGPPTRIRSEIRELASRLSPRRRFARARPIARPWTRWR